MRSDELDYDLPPELIAQHPATRRDASRLLVYERATGAVRHRTFADLPAELGGELVVVNDTKVVPARLSCKRETGGERRGAARSSRSVTATGRRSRARRAGFARASGSARWSCSSRSGRDGGACASMVSRTGSRRCRPTSASRSPSPGRYQTVYAVDSGSAAAPTAGLHFTPEMLARLEVERVTLHVGLDTFRPLAVDELEEHELHGERYRVAPEAWARIEAAERVLAVGTTTVRVLETIARGRPARGPNNALHPAGLRIRACRRAPDELPPAALDAARARDGVRGRRTGARPVPARDRRAVPLLLLR